MALYMVFQFLGGVVAALLSLWVHGNAMQLEPGAGYSYGGAALIVDYGDWRSLKQKIS